MCILLMSIKVLIVRWAWESYSHLILLFHFAQIKMFVCKYKYRNIIVGYKFKALEFSLISQSFWLCVHHMQFEASIYERQHGWINSNLLCQPFMLIKGWLECSWVRYAFDFAITKLITSFLKLNLRRIHLNNCKIVKVDVFCCSNANHKHQGNIIRK